VLGNDGFPAIDLVCALIRSAAAPP
jgi:hypothetical protein